MVVGGGAGWMGIKGRKNGTTVIAQSVKYTFKKRINSKWIKDLNIRFETIKFLEEDIGSKISAIACSNIFSDISSQARETKGKKPNGTTSNSEIFVWQRKSSTK